MYFKHLMQVLYMLCFMFLLTSCINSKQPDSKAEINKLHINEIIGTILNNIQVYVAGYLPRPLNSDTNSDPLEINPHILPTPNLPGTGPRYEWYDYDIVLHVDIRRFDITASISQGQLTINHDNNNHNGGSDSTYRTREHSNYNTNPGFNRSLDATTFEANNTLERVSINPGSNTSGNHLKNNIPCFNQSEIGVPTHVSQDGAASGVCIAELIPNGIPTLTEETRLIASGRGGETLSLTEVLFDPSMIGERTRIETFALWPHDFLSPARMARAGFYYNNSGDMVRCFCCGTELEDWQPGDDPIEEHRRLSPECEYMQMLNDQDNDICQLTLHSISIDQSATMQTENGDSFAQVCSANDTKVNVVTSGLGAANNRVRQKKRNTANSRLASTTEVGQSVTISRRERVENILESQDAAIVLREGFSRAQVAEAVHSLIEGNLMLDFEVTHELLRGTLMSMGIRPSRRPNLVDEETSEDNSNF